MTSENTYITPGTAIEVNVMGCDASGAAAELPESGLTYVATNGSFADGVFTSDGTVGEATVTAYYNDEVVGDITIHVVVPTEFSFNSANFVVPYRKSVSLDITALYGSIEMVCKASDFTFTLSNDTLGTISDGIFTAVSEEVENCEGTLTATLVHNTELTATAGIALGKGSEVLYDFEDQDLHGWYRSTSANYNYDNPAGETAIVDATTGKVHSGNYAMAVETDFSNNLEAGFQLAGLYNKEEIVLEKATRIGMWIYIPDEVLGIRIDSGISGFTGNWEIAGAGKATVTEAGFAYAFDESGWYYISKDISSATSAVTIKADTQLVKFYIHQKDGKNDYEYGDQTDVNGKLASGRIWVGTYPSNGLLPKGYYEFGADGKMLQGVVEKTDGLYYYDLGNTEYMGLIERDGEYYYVNEGGKLEIGRVYVGSYPSNGLVTKGYYEFGEDGAMLNGFEQLADGLYYYNKGVARYYGLKVIDNDLYYIEEGGKVMTGKVYVGTYASNGLLPKGNYTFAEDGKFVK